MIKSKLCILLITTVVVSMLWISASGSPAVDYADGENNDRELEAEGQRVARKAVFYGGTHTGDVDKLGSNVEFRPPVDKAVGKEADKEVDKDIDLDWTHPFYGRKAGAKREIRRVCFNVFDHHP